MAQATAMAKNLSMTTPVAMALTTAMAMALLSLPTLSRPSVGAVAGEAGAGIVPSSAQPSVGAVAGVGAAAGEVGAGVDGSDESLCATSRRRGCYALS